MLLTTQNKNREKVKSSRIVDVQILKGKIYGNNKHNYPRLKVFSKTEKKIIKG